MTTATSFEYTEDKKFGTHYFTFPNATTAEQVKMCLESKHLVKGKAIVLIGLDQRVVDDYNSIDEKSSVREPARFQTIYKSKRYYLIRNGSNCPELFQEKIIAGHVAVIVKYGGSAYQILVKDRTKSMIGCPGGTFNAVDEKCLSSENQTLSEQSPKYLSSGFHSEKQSSELTDEKKEALLYRVIAARELEEETSGQFGDHKIDGLHVDYKDLVPFLTVEHKSSLFGMNDLPDTQVIFRHYIDFDSYMIEETKKFSAMYSDTDSKFFDMSHNLLANLFCSKNKDGDNYTMKFTDNSEIEYVHAMKLDLRLQLNSEEKAETIMKTVQSTVPKFKVYSENHPRISIVHTMAGYAAMGKIVKYPEFVYKIDATKTPGFHPVIQSLSFY